MLVPLFMLILFLLTSSFADGLCTAEFFDR